MVLIKIARSGQRILFLATALSLLLVAAGLLLAQRSINQIDQLRPQIAQLFSDGLGAPVALGALAADWHGPIPRLRIESIKLFNEHGETPLQLASARLELNLWKSLWHRSLVWRELSVDTVRVVLREESLGRWNLAGLPPRASTLNMRALLAPLAYSRFVQVSSLQIELQALHGERWQAEGTQLRVESEADFHRLQATLNFGQQQAAPIQLVAEGWGDPLDREAFGGAGYLQLDDLDLAAPLASVGVSLFPDLFVDLEGLAELSVPLRGDLWFTLNQGGVVELHGLLKAERIPLDWIRDVDPLTDLSTELSGWYTPGQDWGVRMQQINVTWAERTIEPFNMALVSSLQESQQFALSFNQLQADLLVELLSDSGLLLPKWRSLLDELNPRGELGSVTVGRSDGDYFVAAGLRNFSVDNWRGVPGIKGLDGQLELQGERAALQLTDEDGLSLLLSPSYDDYINAERAAGLITARWSVASREFQISGERLDAVALGGRAQVDFYSRRADAGSRADSTLELRIQAANLEGPSWPSYLPNKLPKRLTGWLSAALSEPQIDQFQLLVRGDRDALGELSLSSQVALQLGAGQLDVAPGWPRIENLAGHLLLSEGRVSGSFNQLASGGLALNNARVSLPLGGDQLAISAYSTAPLDVYMGYLAETPLANPLEVLLGWQYSGRATAAIDLKIPIASGSAMGMTDAVDYTVEVALLESTIDLQQPALTVEQLNGQITISRDAGVVGSGLIGMMAGEPVEFSLFRNIGGQRLRFNGVLNAALLSAVSPLDWQHLVNGSAGLSGLLTLPPVGTDLPVRLTMQSDQIGFAYTLPLPLGKPAESLRQLSADLTFNRNGEQLLSVINEALTAQLVLRAGAISRGVINLGGEQLLPETGQFLLAAELPSADWRAWNNWWQRLPETVFGALLEPVTELQQAPLQVGFRVALEALYEPAFNSDQLTATGQFRRDGVELAFTSQQYSGVGFWPYAVSAQQPISVALAELKLPAATGSLADGQPLKLDGLPAINFSVQKLRYDGRELGSLGFELRPEPNLLRFNQLSGELLGVRLGGEQRLSDSAAVSQLLWHYGGAEPTTAFTGSFATGDIAELSEQLGSEPIADSAEAYMAADVQWPGHPWQLHSQLLQGELAISLARGQFFSRSGGGEAALRAISLFNFANWLRRLQFDFSDVFGDNLAYNRLSGKLQFDRGSVALSPPLTAELPSGNMALAAKLNLFDKTIDGKLVATLPVATNLPWIVALVGGLPAAAGVYLTSKVMSKQLDRLSSISYTLAGPWEDVELSVDRVFARELKE